MRVRALLLLLLTLGLAEPALALDHLLFTFEDADTSSTAALRLYTDRPLERPRVRLEAPGAPPRFVDGEVVAIPTAARWVYRFTLRGLSPRARYTAQVLDEEEPRGRPRDLSPLDPARPLRVVAGGDISPSAAAARMWEAAAAERPDLIVLGGDLAYADGNPILVALWDRLLAQHAAAFAEGPLVPIISAIGNHEVSGGYGGAPDKAPFWFALFGDRAGRSYFLRELPHARLLVLDSGHVAPHGGAQAKLVERALEDPPPPGDWRIAIYHVPLFPSVRPLSEIYSVRGRRAWLKPFRAGLDLALENHDHALKRTTRSGVLFLGDGCWGTEPRPTLGADYLDRWASAQHLWVLEIEPGVLRARAIDARGRTLDKATLFRPLRAPSAPLSE